MYEKYWQLERKPFEQVSEQRDYYPSETHQGAMLKLRYAVENRRGAALLSGPSGSGKSMLVQALRRQLGPEYSPFVHLVFPQMSGTELLHYLADELGAPQTGPGRGDAGQVVRRLEKFLAENTEQGRHAVVVIDEAQLLAECGSLETIRLLLNFQHEGRPELTLLIVGQPSILPVLARLPGLDQRLGVKTLLRSFAVEETASYIQHRLTAAGARRTIFDSSALDAVHHLTHGLAGQINRLCDLALLIGYAEELRTISGQHVEAVCQELVTVAPE